MVYMVSLLFMVCSLILETRSLGRIYLKYLFCNDEIVALKTQNVLTRFQDKIELKELLKLKNEHCLK